MTKVQIVFFKTRTTLVQKLICWQTDSPYSHVGLVFDGQLLIESQLPEGVQWNTFVYDPAIHDVFYVFQVTPDEGRQIYRFVYSQLGKGYDYWGCLRFISRRRLPENDKWFCSELVFEAFLQAGVSLLNRIDSYQVSPGDLATSPYLCKVN